MTAERLEIGRISVRCFPEDDKVFCEHVHEILAATPLTDPTKIRDVLHERLRVVYPHCDVRIRDSLAGFADVAIYVFRDGKATSKVISDVWCADPGTARLVTDTEGIYVDANEPAAELFGAKREDILGQRAGTFTRPDAAVTDAAELWRALAESGRLHSLAVVRRADATEERVEFVTIKDGDGQGRHVTYMRAVDCVDEAEAVRT